MIKIAEEALTLRMRLTVYQLPQFGFDPGAAFVGAGTAAVAADAWV